jgi:hypothetical protein
LVNISALLVNNGNENKDYTKAIKDCNEWFDYQRKEGRGL